MRIVISAFLMFCGNRAGAVSLNPGEVRLVPETMPRGLALMPSAPAVSRATLASPALSLSIFRPQVVPVVLPAAQPVQARSAAQEEEDLLDERLPSIVADELKYIAPKIREEPLSNEETVAILEATAFKRIRWYHHFINDIQPVPEGVTYPDNRIQLNVRRDWRSYPSYEVYFRVLFSHEYTHRLQNEGVMTRRFGVEIPAVATELLRGMELAGLDGLRQGKINFIGENVLSSFDSGRQWAHSDRQDKSGFYFKGFLGGAAYELAAMTGRWDDAWEFLRRTSTEEPAEAFEAIISK